MFLQEGAHAILKAGRCTKMRLRASAEFQRRGAPTALVSAASHICIGFQSGTILGIPKASAERGTADFAIELKPPAGMGRLLSSLFARCRQQSQHNTGPQHLFKCKKAAFILLLPALLCQMSQPRVAMIPL